MKKIKKRTTKGAQSITAFVTACYCLTCQDCRQGSTEAVNLWNGAQASYSGQSTLQSFYE